jgi:acetolactate synthase small subunit
MHVFHVRYRNTQGTLMRILGAVVRRTIDPAYVQAEPCEHAHKVTLLVDVNAKQVGQLCREWRAIVDVIEVRPGAPIKEVWDSAPLLPHPPQSVGLVEDARGATA